MNLFNPESFLAPAKDAGLNKIRCSLTGQVIATLDDESLIAAINFESYTNPLASIDHIVDALETRWLIQSSRPAPHLTAHKTKDGFKFLREYYPMDLFAILAGRLLFEHTQIVRELDSTDTKRMKMSWLIQLQTWYESSEFAGGPTLDLHTRALETMIRLDAIHNIRHSLYSREVTEMARALRESDFNIVAFTAFVEEVENCGFIALSTMKNPPAGNGMALTAALAQHGMTPEQLILEEERQEKIAANRRRAIQQMQTAAAKSGTVTIRRGVKAVLSMQEVGTVIPPKLAEKYAAELEKRSHKAGTQAVNAPAQPKKTRASAKALSRFGSLDVDF